MNSILKAMLTTMVLSSATFVASAADDKATGTFTVNGATTKVSYAYAREVPSFFDQGKKDIEIILTDVALDAKAQRDSFARMEMAKTGKLHAFELTVNSEGKPVSTSWRHSGFKSASPSGLSSDDVFVARTFAKQTVDASYKAAKPREFFGNAYDFDVAFRAAIMK